jgi:Fur family iron response transcriptional regulator
MKAPVYKSAKTRGELVAQLRSKGITPTQQRIEIAQILFGKMQHVTAEHVLEKVNHGSIKVSKATVYNTLGLFAEKGLLREVVVDPNKLFYDTNLTHHHHLYHTDTGTLDDVPAEQVRIEHLPDLPQGMNIDGVDVIIRVRPSE